MAEVIFSIRYAKGFVVLSGSLDSMTALVSNICAGQSSLPFSMALRKESRECIERIVRQEGQFSRLPAIEASS